MHTFSIESKFTDYTYDIQVYVPENPAPKNGFPVIYVLDGSGYFHYVKDTIRLQSRNSMKTGVDNAVVVGIGHKEEEMKERRFYDYTAPAISYSYPKRFRGNVPKRAGGGEHFQRFIEEELKPIIISNYSINNEMQTLFGHSLAGYFVLWNLFHKGSYQNFIAISPSIWWNNYELNNMSEQFFMFEQLPLKLYMAVGEKEGFMVTDAKTMANTLDASKLIVEYYVAEDENHASVVPTVISKALRFINGEK